MNWKYFVKNLECIVDENHKIYNAYKIIFCAQMLELQYRINTNINNNMYYKIFSGIINYRYIYYTYGTW